MKAPEHPKAELAAALVRGAVSAIPIAGGVIAEVGDLYLNPLEKRKRAWLGEVCQAIEEIEGRFSRVADSLEQDESFVSFLYQATIVALKNHQREKLDALRNALVSSTNPDCPSEDLAFQFLRYVDELSATHLRILAGMDKHAGQLAPCEELEGVYSKLQSLTGEAVDRAMFRSFLQDLDARFLIRIGDVDELPEYASKKATLLLESSKKRPLEVTKFGREFLVFVRRVEP